MSGVQRNRLSDNLACSACGGTIRLGERMTTRSDGVFRFRSHYPACPASQHPARGSNVAAAEHGRALRERGQAK